MLARRYELKFPITIAQKHAFMQRARHALVEDPHGESAVYRVSSQYFDTADLLAYREKLDGERARRKFRLRYYGVDADGHVRAAFMEIKHRVNHTVYKERVRLTDDGAQAILEDAGELLRLADHVTEDERAKAATIHEVHRAAAHGGFRAVHVITYVREAWLGAADRRLRVTFDSGCRALVPDAFADVAGDGGAPILEPDRVIAEIKFDLAIPRWIRDIVEELGLTARRFSKYARGVQALHLMR